MLPKGQSLLDDYQEETPRQIQPDSQIVRKEQDLPPPSSKNRLIAISILLIFFYVLLALTNAASRKNSLLIKELIDSNSQNDQITKDFTSEQPKNQEQDNHLKLPDQQANNQDKSNLGDTKSTASPILSDSLKQIVQWSNQVSDNWDPKRSKAITSGKPLILRGYQQAMPSNVEYDKQQLNNIVNEIQIERSSKQLTESHQKLVSIYHQLRDDIHYNVFYPSLEDRAHAINDYLKSKPAYHYLKLLEENQKLDLTFSREQDSYLKKLSEKYSLKVRKNHSLCIMVGTHNNAQNSQIQRTLNSIFNQDYDNYQVVIANYQSNDATLPLIQAVLQQDQSLKEKTTILSYETESQPYAVWNAAKYCKNDSYIVFLDGSIQILGKNTFQVIDTQINSSKSVFLYSDYFSYDYETGHIAYENTSEYDQSESFLMLYRKLPNKFGKMVIFKAKSLKDVPTQRFSFNGNYFTYTGMDSIIYTLLQASCGRTKRIRQPLFFNLIDSTREERIKQKKKHQLYLISEKLKTDIC